MPKLTKTEKKVLNALYMHDGRRVEVAMHVGGGIALSTMNAHVRSIKRKLGTHGDIATIKAAIELGVIQLSGGES